MVLFVLRCMHSLKVCNVGIVTTADVKLFWTTHNFHLLKYLTWMCKSYYNLSTGTNHTSQMVTIVPSIKTVLVDRVFPAVAHRVVVVVSPDNTAAAGSDPGPGVAGT